MNPSTDTFNKKSGEIPDFLINLLVSGWLVLFGVRSLIITPLVWNGTITAEQLAALDPTLLKIYLILFSLTLLVAALRAVRHAERKPQSDTAPSPESET